MAIQDQRTYAAASTPRPVVSSLCREVRDRWSMPGRPDAAPARWSPMYFTAIELAVLNDLAAGLSDREIALRLMLFEPSVRTALRSICRKLGVRNRAEAVDQAARREDF